MRRRLGGLSVFILVVSVCCVESLLAQVIKVGMVLRKDEPYKSMSDSIKDTIYQTQDDINESGGVIVNGRTTKVEIVIEYVPGPTETTSNYDRLAKLEKVNLLLGPITKSEQIDASEVASRTKIPIILFGPDAVLNVRCVAQNDYVYAVPSVEGYLTPKGNWNMPKGTPKFLEKESYDSGKETYQYAVSASASLVMAMKAVAESGSIDSDSLNRQLKAKNKQYETFYGKIGFVCPGPGCADGGGCPSGHVICNVNGVQTCCQP
jgi:ABC-type branched-subunit amino acid transport system substrate-binding protein